MGLLSDPGTRKQIVNVISKYEKYLEFLCYVAGAVFFLGMAHKELNNSVYMSENALLPGLVDADFYDDNGARKFYKDYKTHHKSLKEKIESIPENKRDDSPLFDLPVEWLVKHMRDIGLDTYVHNYTFRYPASILKDQVLRGQNVYGILRAPRAARTEAIVLTVPYRPPGSDTEKTTPGMALLLGVAKGFRRKTYWAKDVIFLVTSHENIGMQAWLSAYHHSPMQYIFPGELHGRSGAIQAAVNLEMGLEKINMVDIKLEGLNGQLPNLDLVNTVVKLCHKERILCTLQKRPNHPHPLTYEGWAYTVKTMLYMMWHQASGAPTGNHGLFHRYHIEAVTLYGFKETAAPAPDFSFEEFGRVIEGVFRSLNNLLERFHQSFFFYLLPSTVRYVSIGLYFPPYGLLAAPILIKAVALWISYTFEQGETKEKSHDESKENDQSNGENESVKTSQTAQSKDTEVTERDSKEKARKETKESESKETQEEDGIDTAEQLSVEGSGGFSSVIPHFVMAFLFGLGSCYAPTFFVQTATTLRMGPDEGLLMGLFAVQLSAMYFPRMLRSKTKEKKGISGANWKLLKCMSLLMLGVVVFATALMNISLAFFITLLSTPVVVIVQPRQSRLVNLLQYVALMAISPLASLVIVGAVNHLMTSSVTSIHDVMDDPGSMLLGAWKEAQSALLYTVFDSYMYGNWTYSLLTIAYWPIWLLFWSLLWTDPIVRGSKM